MKGRDYIVIVVSLILLGGGLWTLRRCSEQQAPSAIALTPEDSLELARFDAEIQADSLQRAAARQARYDSIRQSWERNRRGAHPLSERAKAYLADRARWDSIRATRPEKLAEGVRLSLNDADSAALTRVPLIGAARAAQILSYGRRLGGYVSPSQILEIEGMPPEVTRWFEVASGAETQRIAINKADFKTLVRHPYLSFDQVKEIMNYRRVHGPLLSWRDLSLSRQFSQKDFDRLTPYISFE